jgi:hypothetical protein
VERASTEAIKQGFLTADLVGSEKAKSTSEVGDFITAAIQ